MKNKCGYLFYKYKELIERSGEEFSAENLQQEELFDEEFSEELVYDLPEFFAELGEVNITDDEMLYDAENIIGSYLLQIRQHFI